MSIIRCPLFTSLLKICSVPCLAQWTMTRIWVCTSMIVNRSFTEQGPLILLSCGESELFIVSCHITKSFLPRKFPLEMMNCSCLSLFLALVFKLSPGIAVDIFRSCFFSNMGGNQWFWIKNWRQPDSP